jgi:hypothetical protein
VSEDLRNASRLYAIGFAKIFRTAATRITMEAMHVSRATAIHVIERGQFGMEYRVLEDSEELQEGWMTCRRSALQLGANQSRDFRSWYIHGLVRGKAGSAALSMHLCGCMLSSVGQSTLKPVPHAIHPRYQHIHQQIVGYSNYGSYIP